MARDRKDRSESWYMEHRGGSLLHFAHITNYTSWRAAQTVLGFPKQIPDGLLDVTFPEKPEPDPFLIEIEAYPSQDTLDQIRKDLALVLLTRGVLPDVLLLVLQLKGNQSILSEQVVRSAHGLTTLGLEIHVVDLWKLPATDLLSVGDIGLVPWVPLTQSEDAPEVLLQKCRDLIDQRARPDEKDNLLAMIRVMAEMR
jgi:hypothetical protein